MNEINEQDMAQVSGGVSQAEIDEQIRVAMEEFKQKLCLDCENFKIGKYGTCRIDLYGHITDAIEKGKTPALRCPQKH